MPFHQIGDVPCLAWFQLRFNSVLPQSFYVGRDAIRAPSLSSESHTMLGTVLLVVLILLLLGALPTWPHSQSWGYGPTGGLGLIVVIVLILVVMGKL